MFTDLSQFFENRALFKDSSETENILKKFEICFILDVSMYTEPI